MADYDVGAAGLSSPPSSAVLTTYRPAILVRNYGIHARLAVGYIRIYRAGLLVFSADVYSGTIQPGATGVALADKYWTPTLTGAYFAQGYVSCDNDQVAANNPLAPVPFTVTAEPPPPPPVVTPHASQHEDGGEDQLTVDGLPGQLAEPQIPFAHASNHQLGGSDVVDVAGLPGQLADEQKPAAHGNEAHSPSFATNAQIAESIGIHNQSLTAHEDAITHGIDVHNADADAHGGNLEHVANKDAANGYAGLDGDSLLDPDQIPASVTSGLQPLSEKGQPDGYAGLDGDALIPESVIPFKETGTATALAEPAPGVSTSPARSDHTHRSGMKSLGGAGHDDTRAGSASGIILLDQVFDTSGATYPKFTPLVVIRGHITMHTAFALTGHFHALVMGGPTSGNNILSTLLESSTTHPFEHIFDVTWYLHTLTNRITCSADVVYHWRDLFTGVTGLKIETGSNFYSASLIFGARATADILAGDSATDVNYHWYVAHDSLGFGPSLP